MRYFEFYIIEGFREAQVDFEKIADRDTVAKTIDQYKNLVNRNQLTGPERNIDYWRKQGWREFYKTVTQLSDRTTATQQKRRADRGKSITISESDKWLVVVPLDKSASCFHGRSTDWCTASPVSNYFEQYFYRDEVVLIYCLNKESGEKWAIAAHKRLEDIELFDKEDNKITEQQFQQDTGMDPMAIRNRVMQQTQDDVNTSRATYNQWVARLTRLIPGVTERDKDIEELLFRTRHGPLTRQYLDRTGVSQYPDHIIVSAVMEPPDGQDQSRHEPHTYFLKQKAPSMSLINSALRANPIAAQYVDDLPLKLQQVLIKNSAFNIAYIKNPHEETQLYAVGEDPSLIKYIKKPDYEVLMAVARSSEAFMLAFVENVPESVLMIGVQNSVSLLRDLENPSFNVIKAAVQDYAGSIAHLEPHILGRYRRQLPELVDVNHDVLKYLPPSMLTGEIINRGLRQEPLLAAKLHDRGITIQDDQWVEALHLADGWTAEELMRSMPLDVAWYSMGNTWEKMINNPDKNIDQYDEANLLLIFYQRLKKDQDADRYMKYFDAIRGYLQSEKLIPGAPPKRVDPTTQDLDPSA